MTTVVKPFVIDGRKGTYAQLDSGLWKFLFDDGEVRIARRTDDDKNERSSITEEVQK
jgi:cytidylate kinase